MTKRTDSTLPSPPPAGAATTTAEAATAEAAVHSPLAVLREWLDALIIAFVLAMFIRIFIVELFKIPSGSMTPTLVGGRVADVDYDRDGHKDLLLFLGSSYQLPLLFSNEGKRLVGRGPVDIAPSEVRIFERYDRILVNKLSYWFQQPQRGDIVVFKVPPVIWQPSKPIYIKRCVGEPGDTLTFDRQDRLLANGQPVLHPDFFQTQRYKLDLGRGEGAVDQPNVTYATSVNDPTRHSIQRINVPPDKIYVFGDNTWSSFDSRYWGGVPLDNVKGRAFFRYYPFSEMRFLHGG